MNLEILYEDPQILVCHKPVGVATETRRLGQRDMVSLLKNYRAGRNEEPYIGLVHRLDQPVEGVMVFAKTPAAAAELSGQVQNRSIGKHYYAVGLIQEGTSETSEEKIRGRMGETGTLTDCILFDKRRNVSSIVPQTTPQAKKAVLDYRVIGADGQRVCFDVTLHTGRHHQIRLQLAHHGCPLVGDAKYGGLQKQEQEEPTGAQNSKVDGKIRDGSQLALCSYRLQFIHPSTKKEMDFSIHPHNPAFDAFADSLT